MKRLFNSADQYIRESDWKDYSLLKLCLFSAGLATGTALSEKAKKPAALGAVVVCVATCMPLMLKFLRIFKKNGKKMAQN